MPRGNPEGYGLDDEFETDDLMDDLSSRMDELPTDDMHRTGTRMRGRTAMDRDVTRATNRLVEDFDDLP